MKNQYTKPPSMGRMRDPQKRGSMSISLNKSGLTIDAEDRAIFAVPLVLTVLAVTGIVIALLWLST